MNPWDSTESAVLCPKIGEISWSSFVRAMPVARSSVLLAHVKSCRNKGVCSLKPREVRHLSLAVSHFDSVQPQVLSLGLVGEGVCFMLWVRAPRKAPPPQEPVGYGSEDDKDVGRRAFPLSLTAATDL